MFIYGVLDKTGQCPNYVSFFKDKDEALKEMDRQMKSLMMEFGWDLKTKKNKVYFDGSVVFSLEKHKLK